MSKIILATLAGLLLIGGSLYFTAPQEGTEEAEPAVEEETEETRELGDYEKGDLISCLAKEGVVIYGSRTCPACAHLAESFGGYEAIEEVYVECAEERTRCNEEKKTGFVPEIQIEGDLHEGRRDPTSLAKATGCEL